MLLEWQTVDKLEGTPQPVELRAFIDDHDAISRLRPLQGRIRQESLDAVQDDLKHRQSAAQSLPGQEVTFSSVGDLLLGRKFKTLIGSWFHLFAELKTLWI